MGLAEIENRLERIVSGAFGRFSKNGIQPAEIGKKLTRQIELEKRIGVRGSIVPNVYSVVLSPEDFAGLQDIVEALHSELLNHVQDYARKKQYKFVGFPTLTVKEDASFQRGVFAVDSNFQEDSEYFGHLFLELPNGLRIPITTELTTIGRLADNTVVIDDSRVSRRHVELKLSRDSSLIAMDLNSTNGTRVNGQRITESVLEEGDDLDVGGIKIRVGRQ